MTEPSLSFTREIESYGFTRDLKKTKVIFFKYEGDDAVTIDYKDLMVIGFSNLRRSRPITMNFSSEEEMIRFFRNDHIKKVLNQ